MEGTAGYAKRVGILTGEGPNRYYLPTLKRASLNRVVRYSNAGLFGQCFCQLKWSFIGGHGWPFHMVCPFTWFDVWLQVWFHACLRRQHLVMQGCPVSYEGSLLAM